MARRHHADEDEPSQADPETGADTRAESGRAERADRTARAKAAAATVRSRIAQLVWIVCALAALMLAVGALCVALKANPGNGLVKFCIDTADKLDFGAFSRTDGVAHWKGHTHAALTKNALVNWGLAAVVWLLIGKVVERIVQPRTTRVG
jgi:hypothetical protein